MVELPLREFEITRRQKESVLVVEVLVGKMAIHTVLYSLTPSILYSLTPYSLIYSGKQKESEEDNKSGGVFTQPCCLNRATTTNKQQQ